MWQRCTLQRACSYCYYVFCALYRKSWFLPLVNIRTEGIHAVCACVCACLPACLRGSVCVSVCGSACVCGWVGGWVAVGGWVFADRDTIGRFYSNHLCYNSNGTSPSDPSLIFNCPYNKYFLLTPQGSTRLALCRPV